MCGFSTLIFWSLNFDDGNTAAAQSAAQYFSANVLVWLFRVRVVGVFLSMYVCVCVCELCVRYEKIMNGEECERVKVSS